MTADVALPTPEELEAQADKLEQKALAFRQIAQGIKALNGDAAALLLGGDKPHMNGGAAGPQGQEAVRLIVSDRPGVWKVSDLKEEARKRGYPISDTGVEKAVRRMVENHEATKAGYGRYRFAPQRKEGVGESDASDGAMIPLEQ